MNVKRERVVWCGVEAGGGLMVSRPHSCQVNFTPTAPATGTTPLLSLCPPNIRKIEERERKYIILLILVTSWNSGKNNVLPSN